MKNGIDIISLCSKDGLRVYGHCRLCIVRENSIGLISSCDTLIEEGMDIITKSDELNEIRKNILGLIIANHPRECFKCKSASGNCELQELAYKLGVDFFNNKIKGEHRRNDEIRSIKGITFDIRKCILCGRCISSCKFNAIKFEGSGYNLKVDIDENKCVGAFECIECTKICPSGALILKE